MDIERKLIESRREVCDEIGVGIDLSAGLTERHDWTVFTLAGRLGDACYVIDYRRLRTIGNLEKIDALCAAH